MRIKPILQHFPFLRHYMPAIDIFYVIEQKGWALIVPQ